MTESDRITQWHNFATSWIPDEVKRMLTKEAALEKYIDSESEYFLDQRIRELVFAHEPGDIDSPLGVFALVNIYMHERISKWKAFDPPVSYEGRMLFVKESRRGEGIGEDLVISALYRAIKSNAYIPTYSFTTNKVAAKLFEKLGGKPEMPEDFPHAHDGTDLYKRFACAKLFENTQILCDTCPINNNTALFWETHHDSIPAIAPLEQWEEQPTETKI